MPAREPQRAAPSSLLGSHHQKFASKIVTGSQPFVTTASAPSRRPFGRKGRPYRRITDRLLAGHSGRHCAAGWNLPHEGPLCRFLTRQSPEQTARDRARASWADKKKMPATSRARRASSEVSYSSQPNDCRLANRLLYLIRSLRGSSRDIGRYYFARRFPFFSCGGRAAFLTVCRLADHVHAARVVRIGWRSSGSDVQQPSTRHTLRMSRREAWVNAGGTRRASDAALPMVFVQSRSFDRITWAGRRYSLRVLPHHDGLF